MPLGGLAPLPLRLGGSPEDGWQPEEHARFAADLHAQQQMHPLAIVEVVADSLTSASVQCSRSRSGSNAGEIGATARAVNTEDLASSTSVAVAIAPNGLHGLLVSLGGNSIRSLVRTGSRWAMGTPIAVGQYPIEVKIVPDGSRAIVVCRDSDTVVPLSWSGSAWSAGSAVSVGAGSVPQKVAFTPDGAKALVTTDSGVVPLTYSAGSWTAGTLIFTALFTPGGIAVSANGTDALFCCGDLYPLHYSGGSWSLGTAIAVGSVATDVVIASDGIHALAVSDDSGVAVPLTLSAGTWSAGTSFAVGVTPSWITLSSDGTIALVGDAYDGSVYVVTRSGGTWTVGAHVAGVFNPRNARRPALAIAPDGATALALEYTANTITQLNITAGSIASGTPVSLLGPAELAISSDGLNALVTSYSAGSVAQLSFFGGVWSRYANAVTLSVALPSQYIAPGCAISRGQKPTSGIGALVGGSAISALSSNTYGVNSLGFDVSSPSFPLTAWFEVWGEVEQTEIGEYGADPEKRVSETEGEQPYAYWQLRGLQDGLGSFFSRDPRALVSTENIALARQLALIDRVAERHACNQLPSTSGHAIDRWARLMDVPLGNGGESGLHHWCNLKLQLAATGALETTVAEVLASILGDAFVGVVRHEGTLDSPPFPTYWDEGTPGPAELDIGTGAWTTDRARITVQLQSVVGMNDSQIQRMADVDMAGFLDFALPSWCSWDWTLTSGGFVLGTSVLGRESL